MISKVDSVSCLGALGGSGGGFCDGGGVGFGGGVACLFGALGGSGGGFCDGGVVGFGGGVACLFGALLSEDTLLGDGVRDGRLFLGVPREAPKSGRDDEDARLEEPLCALLPEDTLLGDGVHDGPLFLGVPCEAPKSGRDDEDARLEEPLSAFDRCAGALPSRALIKLLITNMTNSWWAAAASSTLCTQLSIDSLSGRYLLPVM